MISHILSFNNFIYYRQDFTIIIQKCFKNSQLFMILNFISGTFAENIYIIKMLFNGFILFICCFLGVWMVYFSL